MKSPMELVKEALELKKNPFAYLHLGHNKTISLIFFNISLRTRLSTQGAARNLGLEVMLMNVEQESWGLEMQDGVIMNGDKAEHVKEAAAVIGQYCEIIIPLSFHRQATGSAQVVLKNILEDLG
jgi:N-succinyl-L-ornithine transcarbamylase